MSKFSFKALVPYITAILLFIVITLVYFSPVLEGKKLQQDDIARHKGMSREVTEFREQTGEEALWTNSMFGGMPAYQISVKYKSNLVRFVDDILMLGLPHPANLVFLYMLGFFILMISLRVNPWLGIAGAIAFAFSSYFFIILEAGHNSKAHAIAYMAPVLAGVVLTYRGRYIPGGILTLLFLALEILAGHPQITYYLLMLLIVFGIAEFIQDARNDKLKHFLKASVIVVVAGIIAVLTHVTSLWATWEYGKYTIRGKTELTTEQENRTTGLDKDYATQWSYGISETFTLFIPNFHGGSSHGKLSENSATYKALIRNQVPEAQARRFISGVPTYWGTQPFTSGPVYVGAIVFFLFVFGLIVIRGKLKWWLLAGTILSILLSWGKNFMPLTDFFLEYVPGYNKFRAVSMTLVIAELAMPILALLAADHVLRNVHDKKKLMKALRTAFYICGGLALLFALFPNLFFSFTSPEDARLSQAYPDWLVEAIRQDRKILFRTDAIRSFLFVLIGGALLAGLIYGKIKKSYFFIIFIALILVDMWAVNRRYVDTDDFVASGAVEKPYSPTDADRIIMKDPDPHFRVLNLTVDPFADARTPYFHKSIGGYHGAKLRRYQELYDHQIRERSNMEMLNMLNAKYLIRSDENNKPVAVPNPEALGNAWFVEDYEIVENADQELEALSDLDPEKKAVIDERFAGLLEGFEPDHDAAGSIELTDYAPNRLVYRSEAAADQMAVFSEIYYEKGWKAFIDGEPAPHFRADYVLRAMIVPAGEHEIVFRFEPKVFEVGEKISLASSILLLALVLGGAAYSVREHFRKEE